MTHFCPNPVAAVYLLMVTQTHIPGLVVTYHDPFLPNPVALSIVVVTQTDIPGQVLKFLIDMIDVIPLPKMLILVDNMNLQSQEIWSTEFKYSEPII